MTINTDFFAASTELKWDEKIAATLRGLTPDDISRILSDELDNAEELYDTIRTRLKVGEGVDYRDSAAVSAAVEENSKDAASLVLLKFPNVIAKIIAVAADDFATWELVKTKWPLPLQLEALYTIAKLTFVDATGFKNFVGNVTGLIQIATAREGQPRALDTTG